MPLSPSLAPRTSYSGGRLRIVRRWVSVATAGALLAGALATPAVAAEPSPSPTAATSSTLSGQVTSAKGVPVPGVHVSASSSASGSSGSGATTDGNGRYSFALQGGAYQVQAFAPDPNPDRHAPVSAEVNVPTDGTPVTLDLKMPWGNFHGEVRGPVVNGTSEIVKGASINVHAPSLPEGAHDQSKSDGSFALALATGTYSVTVHPPYDNPQGYVSTTEQVAVDSAGTQKTLVLQLPNVRGTVLSVDGAPTEGSHVYATNSEGGSSAGTVSGSTGAYSLHLAPGTWTIHADPPYGSSNTVAAGVLQGVVVTDGGAAQEGKDVRLRSTNVRGTVLRPDGSVVAGSYVNAYVDGRYVGYAYTDASGSYGLRLDPSATYTLRAQPPYNDAQMLREGTRTVAVPADETTVLTGQDIVLKAPNLLGRVLLPTGTTGVGETYVYLRDLRGEFIDAARTSADGSFAFFTAAGDYDLSAEAPYDDSTGLLRGVRRVSVAEGVISDGMDVRLRQAPVFGTVFRPGADLAVTYPELSVYDLGKRAPVTLDGSYSRSGGHYALDLPAGRYRVSAHPAWQEDMQKASVDLEVGDTPLARQDIVLGTPGSRPYLAVRVDVPVAAGEEVDGSVQGIELSGDGRLVAFLSDATNLVGGSVPPGSNAYLRDMTAGTTELLTPGDAALPKTDWTSVSELSLSADGRFVAFASDRSDLVANDPYGNDVFLLDRQAGSLRLVSVSPTGTPVGGRAPIVSNDGRTVAFLTTAPELSGSDSYVETLVAADLSDPSAVTTKAVSDPASGQALQPDMSADGTTFAWYGYDGSAWNALRRGAQDASARVVGQAMGGVGYYYGLSPVSLSGDGRLLVYERAETTADGTWTSSLMRHDAAAADTAPQKVVPFEHGEPLGAGVTAPLLSDDGSSLAFQGITPDSRYYQQTAWLHSVAEGSLPLASGKTGEGAYAQVGELTADGGAAALMSSDSLDSSVTKGWQHGWVATRNRDAVAPSWSSPGTALTAGSVGSTLAELAWTGATDDIAVTQYRLFRGDSTTPLATLPATARSFVVDGLEPGTLYRFRIEAGDAAGRWSETDPTVEVTTKAAAVAGEALLSVTVQTSGSAKLQWDAAAGATAYRVLRKTGTASFAAVTTTKDTATTYTDTGLDAETPYTWVVQAVIDGSATAHTREASATTPSLATPAFEAALPMLSTGLLKLSGTVGLTVRGEPGRAVTVSVTRASLMDGTTVLSSPRPVTSDVGLVEDAASPGTYRGAWQIDEGTTELTSLTARLSDSAGHSVTRSAGRLPLPVSGRLSVTVEGAPELLAGASVAVQEQTTYAGAQAPLLTGEPTALPAAAGSYGVQVYSADGALLAETAGKQVTSGRTTAVPLVARTPVSVASTVHDAAGKAVAGIPVSLSDSTGRYLGSGTTDSTGRALLTRAAVAGSSVIAQVTLPYDSMYDDPGPSAPVVLNSDSATIPFVISGPVEGTVTGIVRNEAGQTVSGASVTATSQRNGLSRSSYGSTDASGRYTLRTVAGEVSIRSSKNGAIAQSTVTVAENGTLEHDVQLAVPDTFRVDLRLLVQHPGEPAPTSPLALDWRTAVHFNVSVSAGSTYSSGYGFPEDATNIVELAAVQGDTVRFCADGAEAGLPGGQVCATKQLGAERSTSIELVLGGGSKLSGTASNADGSAASGFALNVDKVTAAGRERVAGLTSFNSAWSVGLPGAGSYIVEAGDQHSSADAVVEVGDNASVTLPELVLRPRNHFRGVSNAVTAVRPAVQAGQLADLRAGYENVGASVSGAVLRVQVPAGSEAPEAGFLLNGNPVAVTAGAGYVDVPVGAIAAGATGAVRYSLRMPAGAKAGSVLPAVATMRIPDSADEPLMPAEVRAAGLTLEAPTRVTSREVALSGRAEPGAAVEVRDGVAVLGATTASNPGGLWKLPVVLPTRGAVSGHQLVAASGSDRAERFVEYDGSAPQLVRLAMSQIDPQRADGREYSFDPRQGVARFPFVFVPGQTMVVKATFDQPERVVDAKAHIGSSSAPAVRCGSASAAPELCAGVPDGVFVAQMESDGKGDLSFEFDSTSPRLAVDGPIETVDQVQDIVPIPLAGFQPLPDQPGDGSFPETGSATASVEVPVAGETEKVQLQITKSVTTNVEYVPTAADLAQEARSGSPFMGMTIVEDTDGTVTLTGYIPESRLPADSPFLGAPEEGTTTTTSSTMAMRTGSMETWSSQERMALGFGWTHKIIEPVKAAGEKIANNRAVKVAMKIKKVAGPAVALWDAVNAGDKYNAIGDLRDGLGGCTASEAAPYLQEIDDLLDRAMTYDVAKGGMMLTGAIVAIGTGGIAAGGVGAAAFAANAAMKRDLKNRRTELKKKIAGLPCSEDPPPPPNGSPTWIYDPSGYVFEGVPTNRLSGVTATLLSAPTKDGPWTFWDAEPFLQVNPLVTDAEGKYAWDVPEGWWKVEYSKQGYELGVSEALPVLPPQLDVNEGLISLSRPALLSVTQKQDVLTLTFDKPMRTVTVPASAVSVTGPDGNVLDGTVAPVQPEVSPDSGDTLAKAFRWTAAVPLAKGAHTVVVGAGVQAYSGRLLGEAATRQLAVEVAGAPVSSVSATGAPGAAQVNWTPPSEEALAGESVVSYDVSVEPGAVTRSLGAAERSATFRGLLNGTEHTVRVRAVTAAGAGAWTNAVATPTGCAGTRFADVPTTDGFCPNIAWMARQRISTGTVLADGTVLYKPVDAVSRQAMAAFLYRAAGSPAFTAPTESTFADVTAQNNPAFYTFIEWMAATGISTGTKQPSGKPLYKPADGVSRQAMAAFLYRAAGSPAFTAPTESTFADVTAQNNPAFYTFIEWMAATKISTGTAQPSGKPFYAAANMVSRRAMAAFLNRAAALTTTTGSVP